jgi:hypothetical protein
MPRGVPRNGFRMTKNRIAALGRAEPIPSPILTIGVETEEQVEQKLALRWKPWLLLRWRPRTPR